MEKRYKYQDIRVGRDNVSVMDNIVAYKTCRRKTKAQTRIDNIRGSASIQLICYHILPSCTLLNGGVSWRKFYFCSSHEHCGDKKSTRTLDMIYGSRAKEMRAGLASPMLLSEIVYRQRTSAIVNNPYAPSFSQYLMRWLGH